MGEMRFELACCTSALLNEIKVKEITQPMLALTYAFAMASSSETDWAKVNQAIIERWSMSGLLRVKRLAHARMKKP